MPYIYKYVNNETEEPEYVGITKGDYEGLCRRLKAHERDEWHRQGKYTIFYAEVKTQADAEVLEGHFIALYETYNHHNKAKAKWGLCSFAPTVEWCQYKPDFGGTKQKRLEQDIEDIRRLAWAIECDTEELKRDLAGLNTRLTHRLEYANHLKKEAVRCWFNSVFVIPGINESPTSAQIYRATKGDLYRNYKEYTANNPEEWAYTFASGEEFWETMQDIPKLSAITKGAEVYPLMYRSEYFDAISTGVYKRLYGEPERATE